MKRVLLSTCVIAAAVIVYLQAYTGQLVTSGATTQAVTWPGNVTYMVNDQTSAALGNMEAGSDPATAVDNAFATLAAASGLTLTNGGTTTTTDVGADGTNLITFANTPANVSAVGGAIAVTVLSYSTSTFTIVEADMVFNPAFNFSTLGSASMYDVEAITTHEGGHLLGLDHSPICSATMFPYANTADSGPASLSSDDIAGLRSLYPPAGVHPPGSVAGNVLDGSSQPVFGAHVGLHDAITGRAITGTVSLPDGSFQIDQVPPGVYHVIVEPMDGPMTDANLQGGTWSSATMNTSFKTTFLGGAADPTEVVVHAVESVALGNITINSGAPSVNIAGIALTTNPLEVQRPVRASGQLPAAVLAVRGDLGPGRRHRSGQRVHAFTAGSSPSATSTTSGTFGNGDGWKIFPMTAATNTAGGASTASAGMTAPPVTSASTPAASTCPRAFDRHRLGDQLRRVLRSVGTARAW